MATATPPRNRQGLAVLGLRYDRSSGAAPGPSVSFVLEIDGKERVRINVPERMIWVVAPKVEAGATSPAGTFVIPPEVVGPFRDALDSQTAHGSPLWLEFRHPSEDLPALFWEELLQPMVGRPVVRLPYVPFQPLASPVPLDVVLIGSSPQAKAPIALATHLVSLTRAMLDVAHVDVTVHLFADRSAYDDPALKTGLADRLVTDGDHGVVIYDPDAARAFAAPDATSQISELPGDVRSPWLRWITGAMPANRAADLVHFVGHGYRSGDNGAIALAPSPLDDNDRTWARFVGAQQMAAFMTQVGAWGVGFSSPQPCPEASSLRLLADNLARLVPGPVSFHDLGRDPECAAVRDLYAFLAGQTGDTPPASPRLSLYYHPAESALEGAAVTRGGGGSASAPLVLPGPDASAYFAPGSRPPRWVAASQRAMERASSDLFRHSGLSADLDPKVREGADEAMRFVSGLMADAPANRSPEAVVRDATSALGKSADRILSAAKSLGGAAPALESVSATGPPAAAPPEALRDLERYASSLDDARRLLANLADQSAVPADLRSTAMGAAEEVAVHIQSVEAACKVGALEAATGAVAEGRASFPDLLARVAQHTDRVHDLVSRITSKLGGPGAFPWSTGGRP